MMSKGGTTGNTVIAAIQAGNRGLREQFLRDHQDFVAAAVSGVLGGRSIDKHRDEEFNTGLIALNEALDSYDPAKGVTFLYFARQVIARRVIDSLRRDERHRRLTTPLENQGAAHALVTPPDTEKIALREDMRLLTGLLQSFGIDLSQLVHKSPRHRDSKKLAIKLGRMLAEDEELMQHLLTKKSIPLKKLLQKAGVNPKTVERHRIYIIAVALILAGNLDTLKCYINAVDEGGGRD